MADRIPGVMGINPLAEAEVADGPGGSPGAGFVDPGPNGTDPPSPMVARIIAKVDDDWHPPNPDTSPEVEIDAETLADVGEVLKKMDEWGKGGGKLRSEAIPVGTSTNLTVKLQGNLLRRLPKWLNYSKASSAAKKEWDRMLEKLKAHEQRHMEIAIEQGDALAKELIGNDIDKIVPMVTARNAQMAKDQKKMDDDTDHGKKKGVPYGDVTLDTSIE